MVASSCELHGLPGNGSRGILLYSHAAYLCHVIKSLYPTCTALAHLGTACCGQSYVQEAKLSCVNVVSIYALLSAPLPLAQSTVH